MSSRTLKEQIEKGPFLAMHGIPPPSLLFTAGFTMYLQCSSVYTHTAFVCHLNRKELRMKHPWYMKLKLDIQFQLWSLDIKLVAGSANIWV